MKSNKSSIDHAEILALRLAMSRLGNERLNGCSMISTLEPCPMCAQAISFARLSNIIFSAADPKSGGVIHGPKIFESSSCHHKPNVIRFNDNDKSKKNGKKSKDEQSELKAKEKFILSITENGFGKKTSHTEYRVTNRGGKGIIGIINSPRNGNISSSFPVYDGDEILISTNKGRVIRVAVKEIRTAGRNTQGVRIIKLTGEEKVVSADKIDDNLYVGFELDWKLTGPLNDIFVGGIRQQAGVRDTNRRTLQRLEQEYIGITEKLQNLTQFYRNI